MNDAINSAAEYLAQAEQTLQAAYLRHQEIVAACTTIEERLQATSDRREKIRADLAAGALTDREGGALLASADEDLADLRHLLDEARAQATAAAPSAEERAVSMAREALERFGRENLYVALHARVLELEAAFLGALGALCQQGAALGRGRYVSSVFAPSDELHRALWNNVPPPPPAPVATEDEDDGE